MLIQLNLKNYITLMLNRVTSYEKNVGKLLESAFRIFIDAAIYFLFCESEFFIFWESQRVQRHVNLRLGRN